MMSKSGKQNNPNSVEVLLTELQKLQSAGNSVYPKGVFPSQRYHPFLPYTREDDNLFFTASVVHILQGIEAEFTLDERQIAKQIIESAKEPYGLFKNKDGLDVYNFWQTKPSRHFPNGRFMHGFKHFQIPDDVDDTSLVFLTENASKKRVSLLREKLKNHANLSYKKAFNPLPKYQNLKVYSTFFGKKMYIEFDVCVLSNLMRVILPHFKNELNEYDKATLDFISEVILSDEHIELPFYSAPNYPTTELIIYHVARLVPLLPDSYKNKIEEKLIADAKKFIVYSKGMNRVLLESSLLKLGVELPNISTSVMELKMGSSMEPMSSSNEQLIGGKDFFFFHAGMITAFENKLAQNLASNSFFHLRYTSKALNRALLIENMVLKQRLIP